MAVSVHNQEILSSFLTLLLLYIVGGKASECNEWNSKYPIRLWIKSYRNRWADRAFLNEKAFSYVEFILIAEMVEADLFQE